MEKFASCKKVSVKLQAFYSLKKKVDGMIKSGDYSDAKSVSDEIAVVAREVKEMMIYKDWKQYKDGEVVVRNSFGFGEGGDDKSAVATREVWSSHPSGIITDMLGPMLDVFDENGSKEVYKDLDLDEQTRKTCEEMMAVTIQWKNHPKGFMVRRKDGSLWLNGEEKMADQSNPNLWLSHPEGYTTLDKNKDVLLNGKEKLCHLDWDEDPYEMVQWHPDGILVVLEQKDGKLKLMLNNEIELACDLPRDIAISPHPQGYLIWRDGEMLLNNEDVLARGVESEGLSFDWHPDGVIVYDNKSWTFYNGDSATKKESDE